MLIIRQIEPSDLAVSIEVDPYVPIAVRTFSAPIGAAFYRVGNFATSLVEVPIDPVSGTIRGIKVVYFDRVETVIDHHSLPLCQGLPVTIPELIPQRRLDDLREVTVALAEDRLVIDWSNGLKFDTKVQHDRLSFLVGNNFLLGSVIGPLTESEKKCLLAHMPRSNY